MLNIEKIRRDFPILQEKINKRGLVYLDNAATTQKPNCVIESLVNYYSHCNSNIHRGVHTLSQRATGCYENARATIQKFINAKHSEEIIFTRGATEAINLVASSYGDININPGDEILITHLEHHSNIVPWQILCQKKSAKLVVAPINDKGEIEIEEFFKLLSPRTKLVAVSHVSNSLGTINPIEDIIKSARILKIPVLIDAAQSIQHLPIDVQLIDCDFLVASGHKMYAPTGIGFLYAKKNILEKMPPYQSGGDMILSVSFEKTIYNDLPYMFEAGTQNISGAISLAAAINYIQDIGIKNILEYENNLLSYATEKLLKIPQLKIIGTSQNKSSVISFVIDGVHPHDVGTMLDTMGVAVRTGNHCYEPAMKKFNLSGTTRASFAFYNTEQEIDILVAAIKQVVTMFS